MKKLYSLGLFPHVLVVLIKDIAGGGSSPGLNASNHGFEPPISGYLENMSPVGSPDYPIPLGLTDAKFSLFFFPIRQNFMLNKLR